MYIHKTCMHTYPHLYIYNMHITSVIVSDIKQAFQWLIDHYFN